MGADFLYWGSNFLHLIGFKFCCLASHTVPRLLQSAIPDAIVSCHWWCVVVSMSPVWGHTNSWGPPLWRLCRGGGQGQCLLHLCKHSVHKLRFLLRGDVFHEQVCCRKCIGLMGGNSFRLGPRLVRAYFALSVFLFALRLFARVLVRA
jgi:hypothetical protein